MTVAETLPAMPFDRSDVLDIAPTYRLLQAGRPISQVRTPAGDPAWLVTGYDLVRELMARDGLGRAHPDPEHAPRFSKSALFMGGSIGAYDSEPADHARLRRLLTRSFMVKRMNALRPHVEEIVAGLLDRLASSPQPADLHDRLSTPLSIMVICELLGVPYDDRDRFRGWADASSLWDAEAAIAGMGRLLTYMSELIERKKAQPAPDVISDLLAHQDDPEDRFDDGVLLELCVGLLMAGYETTVARIDLGAALLLSHPDELALLRSDPSLLQAAVEEILRMAAPTEGVTLRYARDVMEAGGVTIRAGDLVLLSMDAANRDERAFPDPARFDIRRTGSQHLAFGYGGHFCLGAGLARVEIQTALGALVTRFPTLRLAVPVEELEIRHSSPVGGLLGVPVAW